MILRLTKLDPRQIDGLLAASQSEGFRSVARLREEWENRSNRFNKPGEGVFGLSIGGELVAIGGVNRLDDSTGRLRRFYVLPAHRRRGLGTRLLHHILDHAAGRFQRVVLRTDTDAADRFYLARGFRRIQDCGDATHIMQMERAEAAG